MMIVDMPPLLRNMSMFGLRITTRMKQSCKWVLLQESIGRGENRSLSGVPVAVLFWIPEDFEDKKEYCPCVTKLTKGLR